MANYTRGIPVRAVVGGVPVALTPEMVGDDVAAAAGGRAAIVGSGLPTGGSQGATLRKSSTADNDTRWADTAGAMSLGFASIIGSGGGARPSGYGATLWDGSIEPLEGQSGDLWLVT